MHNYISVNLNRLSLPPYIVLSQRWSILSVSLSSRSHLVLEMLMGSCYCVAYTVSCFWVGLLALSDHQRSILGSALKLDHTLRASVCAKYGKHSFQLSIWCWKGEEKLSKKKNICPLSWVWSMKKSPPHRPVTKRREGNVLYSVQSCRRICIW